jgi:hypothetical protein
MINKKAYMLESDPKYVAEQIYNIIKIMIMRMPMDKRPSSFVNLKGRINNFNIAEISSKRNPGGASIGVSIGLVKNILNGRDPFFIKLVLDELYKIL